MLITWKWNPLQNVEHEFHGNNQMSRGIPFIAKLFKIYEIYSKMETHVSSYCLP